jgi:hypothetical protein
MLVSRRGPVKHLLLVVMLLTSVAYGQKTYSKGQVVKWQRQACGQFVLPQKPVGGIEQPNITSTEYCNEYQIKTADRLILISGSRHASLDNGQEVEYRVEKKNMFILKDRGKEDKFTIVGEETP